MKLTLHAESLEEVLSTMDECQLADSFLNDGFFAFSPKELEDIGRSIQKGKKPEQAYRDYLLGQLEDEGKEAFSQVQVGFGLEEFAPLDPLPYVTDPYYQRVMGAIKGRKRFGDWVYEEKRYLPYQLFVFDKVRQSELIPTVRYSPVGYFEKGFAYPALSQNGRVYMSLIPHEMNTMEEAIQKASGHVCTMGLGMGYFAFRTSQKDNVSKVTVLERDKDVIALFKNVFLPLFDHPEKIEVIQIEDALTYAPKQPFDYLFADLHHDAVDGLLPYLQILRLEGFAKQKDVWIEKAILEYFRRHLLALIEEEANGYKDEDYKNPSNESEEVLSALHFHLKNAPIPDVDALLSLLTDESLRRIGKEMKLPR
ncbi:MAG: hypothetical protein K6E59_01220 [Bacilli bacterium]|nr:hypothetical protein [Bacilli bacterium]